MDKLNVVTEINYEPHASLLQYYTLRTQYGRCSGPFYLLNVLSDGQNGA